MNEPLTVKPLTLWIKLAYIAGQLGWSIASFGVMNLLFYFYDANFVEGVPMFPRFLPTIAILSIIAGVGRLLDAVTDPLIAGLSDRNKHPFGRRRLFMAIGGLPFVVLSVMVFMPPILGTSWINGAWVAVMVLLFYIAMTIYITPYFALIAELGHDSKGRLELSTWIAIAWALGFLVGNSIYALQGVFEYKGFSSLHALQITLAIFALVSLILVYIPVIFIDEKKYCYPRTSKQGIVEAVRSSFQNKNFRTFMSKMGTAVTLFIFPYVSHLGGGDKITALGLRGSLFLAALFLTLGLIIFLKYDEKGIDRILETHRKL